MTEASESVLEYKDLSPDELAAQAAQAQEEARKTAAEELVQEADRLLAQKKSLEDVPPELVLAAAIDRHAKSIDRFAAAHERIADSVELISENYRMYVDKTFTAIK